MKVRFDPEPDLNEILVTKLIFMRLNYNFVV